MSALGEALGPTPRGASFRAISWRASIKLAIATLLVVELLLRRGALDCALGRGVPASFAILSATGLALVLFGSRLDVLAAGRTIATVGAERDDVHDADRRRHH
jgi:hypothetical protein